MAEERPLIGGTYRHYKGRTYQVIALARMEGMSADSLYVVYEGTFDGKIWLRPLAQWFQMVTPNAGDRTPVQRFTYEGPKKLNVTGAT